MSDIPVSRSPAIFAQFFRELGGLFQAEYRLAKEEISTNMSYAVRGLMMVGAAFLFALVAFHALALAAVLGLTSLGLNMGLAALIVFLACLVLAGVALIVAKRRLSLDTLTPNRTIRQIKTDLQTLEEVRHGNPNY